MPFGNEELKGNEVLVRMGLSERKKAFEKKRVIEMNEVFGTKGTKCQE